MTASPGREVDANLLRSAAEARAQPQDSGGQDLGDLVEALGRGHQVGVKGFGQRRDALAGWRRSSRRQDNRAIAGRIDKSNT
jgi:hypothetical protein